VGFVEAVLGVAAQAGASDLRIGVGDLPIVKIGGVGWRRLSEFDPVTSEQAEATAIWAAHRPLDEEDFEDMDVDAAATFVAAHGQYRLRANVYRERRGWAVSLRFIPDQPPALESLGLPAIVESFADLERGLVLITGVTGSGKSTTLAGIIDRINGRHAVAVQTIENPVEYLHTSRKASIHQREVGTDTDGFATAMRSAMRQNPDIVLVGEIRDYEEISTAVTLAETGHLVFATLHTSSAAETITRLVNVFPSEGQNQIRTQLSMVLKAVVCQHLFPRQDDPNKGCVVAEIMLTNDSLATLIRSGSTDKLTTYILDGRQEGMQHMDEALADAVLDGRIAEAAALPWVTREQQFQQRMRNQRR
jgi:twitching motility protein PilT